MDGHIRPISLSPSPSPPSDRKTGLKVSSSSRMPQINGGGGHASSSYVKRQVPVQATTSYIGHLPRSKQQGASIPSIPVVSGSSARVPSTFLNGNGHVTSQHGGQSHSLGLPSFLQKFAKSEQALPGAFPVSSKEAQAESSRSVKSEASHVVKPESSSMATVDLTEDIDESDDFTIVKSEGPGTSITAQQQQQQHARRVVCIGFIEAVILSLSGLPDTFCGQRLGNPTAYNAHPKWNRNDWPKGYEYYLEPGYRPIDLQASPPDQVNVFELISPMEMAERTQGQIKEPRNRDSPFGNLSSRFGPPLHRLLTGRRIMVVGRCRIVPPETGKNYMHAVELLCMVQRTDAHHVAAYLRACNINLLVPRGYVSEVFVGSPPLEMQTFEVATSSQSSQPILTSSRGTIVAQESQDTEEEKRKQVDAVYASLPEGESLPEKEADETFIHTPLLPHQKRALAFLTDREKHRTFEEDGKEGNIVSLYKVKMQYGRIGSYKSVVTQAEQGRQPRICRGAILADDMGLGKTLTAISLIASTFNEAREWSKQKSARNGRDMHGKKEFPSSPSVVASNDGEDDFSVEDFNINVTRVPRISSRPSKTKSQNMTSLKAELAKNQSLARIKKRSRATLIVLPLTLVSAWEAQIREHWAPDYQPHIYVHHGTSRDTEPARIARHHIVMTTYMTLANEYDMMVLDETLQTSQDVTEDDDDEEDDEIDFRMPGQKGKRPTRKKDKGRKKQIRLEKRKDKVGDNLSPLHMIEWYRIVLDEAHYIKEARTLSSRAVCALQAVNRLCLTGTPIQNHIDDLYALIRFLRLEPFDDFATWMQYCGSGVGRAALRHADSDGQDLLENAAIARIQLIMKFLTLRRTKHTRNADGSPLIRLPSKHSRLIKLQFDDYERATYEAMHNMYKENYEKMKENDRVKFNYASILHEISNLRMTCDHSELVDASVDRKTSNDAAQSLLDDGMTRDRAVRFFDLLCSSDQAHCAICQHDLSAFMEEATGGSPAEEEGEDGPMKQPVILKCLHVFCKDCLQGRVGITKITKPKEADTFACPACESVMQALMDVRVLVAGDIEQKGIKDVLANQKLGADRNVPIDKRSDYSSKIRALIEELEVFSRSNPASKIYDPDAPHLEQVAADATEKEAGREAVYVAESAQSTVPIKSIVFSQWTSMLDRVARAVHRAGIRIARLDGRMQRSERNEHLERFRSDPSVEVMLISLKAGGVGLNLVSACRAYLMEPYWNPAVEDQGLDRVHRLGQFRAVVTTKYVVDRTIEEQMLVLQKRKTQIAESVGSKKRTPMTRFEELDTLFARGGTRNNGTGGGSSDTEEEVNVVDDGGSDTASDG